LAPTAAFGTDTETLHFTETVSFTMENPAPVHYGEPRSGAVGTVTSVIATDEFTCR